MTLTINIPADIEAGLSSDAARHGLPLPEYVLRVLQDAVEAQQAGGRHPVLDLADRVRESVPASEWAELPSDLAANVDHYLYGHPKETA